MTRKHSSILEHSCVSRRHHCSDRLRCIDCVPPHVQNAHIISGYRHEYSYWEAVTSLFTLHNETLNVWSHIFGILLFLYLLYDVVVHAPTIQSLLGMMDSQMTVVQSLLAHPSQHQEAALRTEVGALMHGWELIRKEFLPQSVETLSLLMPQLETAALSSKTGAQPDLAVLIPLVDRIHAEFRSFLQLVETALFQQNLEHHLVPLWPLVCFLLGTLCCFGFSSLFHLFCAVGNRETYVFFQKFDYAGISLILAGGYSPIMYYLYEFGVLRIYYLAIAQALAACIFGFLLTDAAYQPAWRTFRVFMFIVYGLFAVVPVVHATFVLASDHPFFFDAVFRLGVTGACLVISAIAFYLIRLPERLASGRFDIWFQSHQFWHVSIIVAAILHYQMSYDLWRFAHFSLMSSVSPLI